MPHIVTEKCIKCKYTDCVEVCPVDCFFEGKDCLVIDPDICIDCGVCIPECPVEAIVDDQSHIDGRSVEDIISEQDESSLTQKQQDLRYMAEFNKEKSRQFPNITQKKDPPGDAREWEHKNGKINLIKG